MKKQLLMTFSITLFSVYGCQIVVSPTPGNNPTPTPVSTVNSPSPSSTPTPVSTNSPTPSPSPSAQSHNTYDLPLTALWRIEAGPSTTVEVKQDGTFNYQQQGGALYTRKLSTSEVSNLKDLLNQLDFAKLAQGDTTATDGSHGIPGTGDDYTMIVNGTEQTYTTRTFPNLVHTQAYLDAAQQLRTYLQGLKK